MKKNQKMDKSQYLQSLRSGPCVLLEEAGWEPRQIRVRFRDEHTVCPSGLPISDLEVSSDRLFGEVPP